MRNKDIYNNIDDFLNKLPENFSILEEQIDVETQIEYFDFIQKNRINNSESEDITELFLQLESKDNDDNDKKKALVSLASIEDVKAFRILESFQKEAPKNLENWATLALQESRILIENFLLEKEGTQVFISSGMGGKGNKLRYFVAGFLEKNQFFSENTQKLIKEEFKFYFDEQKAEIEEITFNDEFILLSVLIPIKVNVKNLLETTIKSCKQLGANLNEHFLVTNVKKLEIEEIRKIMTNNKNTDEIQFPE
jgi:hypothetical protein